MVERRPTAVLISGSGSNLQALLDASQDPSFPADIRLVISNKPSAYGLVRAEEAGIKTAIVPHRDYPSREEFDAAVNAVLIANAIEFVCLAGFMRVLSAGFVEAWSGRMLNIHPSLLPAFPGNRAHEQVIASSVTLSGCSVHLVTPDLDGGPILAQGAVQRLPDDTVDTLSARVLASEHHLYPLAVRSFLRAPNDPAPTPPSEHLISIDPTRRFSYNR